MSIRLKLDNIPYEERLSISKLSFEKKQSQYVYTPPETITAYDVEEEYLYVPFQYALQNIKNTQKPTRKSFPKAAMKFTGKLRPLQVEVKKEALKLLNKQGSCILALYTGGGKTFTSIYLACKIKLKTLIIINRLVLIKQWKETIEKATPLSEVQVVYAKTKINKDADFYIINAINVSKKGKDFFRDVGCVIVDEVHLLATKVLSKCFFYVYPRYLIGLSATPTRPDGMDLLLHAFFGDKIIYRKLHREHYVYKIKTDLKPEYKLAKNGKIDWNSVLNWQATNEERNEIILKIIKKFKDRNFLVLCKRVAHVKYLVEKLEESDEDVTSLVGSKKFFNTESRILIGTVQKCGVGFDHPKLNTLIIASDLLEYYIQYLGRVFRTEEVIPIIFDIVDDHGVLKKHYYTRRKVYKEHGGIIKNTNMKLII